MRKLKFPPHKLFLTQPQLDKVIEYGKPKKTDGGWQRTFKRINDEAVFNNGTIITRVSQKDLDNLKKWANISGSGSYQDWCREVLTANKITWP